MTILICQAGITPLPEPAITGFEVDEDGYLFILGIGFSQSDMWGDFATAAPAIRHGVTTGKVLPFVVAPGSTDTSIPWGNLGPVDPGDISWVAVCMESAKFGEDPAVSDGWLLYLVP